jgi:hypothetical protein
MLEIKNANANLKLDFTSLGVKIASFDTNKKLYF